VRAATCDSRGSFFAYISFEGWRGRPRHGRVGAERAGFCGAKDQALAGPGTPVAEELDWEGKKGNLVFDEKIV